MTLQAGTRLGPYEIQSLLGAGGMGEVYRARDTRVDRPVALKVLPEEFFEEEERRARFGREAKLLASLNHPGIATLYSFEEIPGATPTSSSASSTSTRHLLVMELVEGDGLDSRIRDGPLPLEEVLVIARQIAEALEAAHEKGIVHRDLKPANVKVTAEGRVKLLDFGLAKIFEGEGDSSKGGSGGDLTKSPTITARATAVGIVLGTAAYMSPEQARGKAVDKRTDVWAFGALVYEMLTGKKAFEGETVSDTLAAILKEDPDWAALPERTPTKVRELLRRCLRREAKQRLHDIADARLELEELTAASASLAISGGAEGSAVSPFEEKQAGLRSTVGRNAPAIRERGSRKFLYLSWAVAAAFAAAAGALALRARTPRVSREGVTRFAVALPEGMRLALDDTPEMAISRDGRKLVISALDEKSGTSHLELRRLDDLQSTPLASTEGAGGPFFSPDGESIGFFADGKLKRMLLSGGTPIVLADAPTHRGGCWDTDGRIVYAPEYTSGLLAIPAAGGAATELAKPDAKKNERTYRWPEALPDGAGILFTIGWLDSAQSYENADIAVLAEGKVRTILKGASMARFVPPDHLVFVRQGTLYAVEFHLAGLTVGGAPVPVLQELGGDPTSGVSYLSVSENGTLAWVPGAALAGRSWLTLTDRSGKPTRLPLPPQDYNTPVFSPDGRRLAYNVGSRTSGPVGDIWTVSLSDLAPSRLTFDGGNAGPVWSPDGRQIGFGLNSGRAQGLYRKPADGSGPAVPFGEPTTTSIIPGSWSPDGRLLAATYVAGTEIRLVDVASGKSRPFESGAAAPAFSPDGRFIAFHVISASGAVNVFVRTVDGDARWQVTTEAGGFPRWAAGGRELLFLANSRMMKVDVETRPSFRAGPPQVLFGGLAGYSWRTNPMVNWDVSPDGKRFAFVEFRSSGTSARQVAIALNWGQTLGTGPAAKGPP